MTAAGFAAAPFHPPLLVVVSQLTDHEEQLNGGTTFALTLAPAPVAATQEANAMNAMKYVLPLSLALVCGSAVAGNTSEASKPEFDKLDVDGDDRISKQEAREHAELESNFDKLARISHRFTAAAPDLPVSPALRLVRVLDVLSKYACAPEPARPLS